MDVDFKTRLPYAQLLAEFLASYIYVGLGCLGTVSDGNIFPNSAMQSGLNFGLLVMTVMQCFFAISGGHINPCVSLVSIAFGGVKWYMGLLYIVAQFAGAFAGYGSMLLMGPSIIVSRSNFCITQRGPNISVGMACFIEFVLSLAWISAVIASWDQRNERFQESKSLRVGILVSALSITGYYFTGASMNPARSLAPAAFKGVMNDIWIYLCMPTLASGLALAFWKIEEWRLGKEQDENNAG